MIHTPLARHMPQAGRRFSARSSIRFRLTAWYTLLLAAMIFSVGFSLSELVERQIRQDVDDRLLQTVRNIVPYVNVQFFQRGGVSIALPPLNPITSPGQLVQVISPDGSIVQQSEGQEADPLPASPLSGDSKRIEYRTAEFGGTNVRTITFPMFIEHTNTLVGGIVVGESLAPVERTLALLRRLLLLASPVGLVVAAIGGWLLAGRALRPVDRITATAASIASGSGNSASLATRLDVPDTGDELARLALTFNQMLDRLEETFNLQRRFVADASHELRTPLTAIRGNIDVLLRQASTGTIDAADLSDALDDLRRESARMSRLIEDLLTLARSEAPPDDRSRRSLIRLDGVADDALRTASSLTTGQRLHLVTAEPITVVADRDRIEELLLILIDNAIRHTPAGGEILVSVERVGQTARLTVRDTGEGIAPEDLPHVFERFYRAGTARDRATGGTGLGLAIAQSIARLHGGEITVTSARGAGATFTVTLPLNSERTPKAPVPMSASQ
jgi:two-component system OmpR family sensor kinase